MRILLLPAVLLAGCAGKDPTIDTDRVDDTDEVEDTDVTETDGPVDADEDGYPEGVDCDDEDADVHPGADEVCDGFDNDCDDKTDGPASIDASTFYADVDADGFGDPASEAVACEAPADHVADPADCDDLDPDVHPGAEESCDEIDQDCDGEVDDGALDQAVWYVDADADGYGAAADSQTACDQPSGYVSDDTDCDDDDPDVHPGSSEIPSDGLDQDCDGIDASEVEYGYRSIWTGRYGGSSPGQYIFTNVEIAAPVTITHIGTAVESTTGLFHLGIYEDSGGTAGALLTAVYDVTLTTGENEVELDVPISVGAGTVWVGIVNEEYYTNGIVSTPSQVCLGKVTSFADPLFDPFPVPCQEFSVQVVMWVAGY